MAESKGIQSPFIPKIATGFCSGMARAGHICGAVSGAVMAVSLFYGRSAPDQDVNTCYTRVQDLLDRFEDEFGTTNCSRLLGCDLGTPEGQEQFAQDNLIEQCRIFTEQATQMAMDVIEGG